jgi:hypothetical protein
VSEQRQPQVVADVHERQSGIPHALENLGVDVTIAPLRAGDYAIGSDVLVERKSVIDLHGSIESGRFWPQIGKLRYASAFPFLFIEGEDIDDGPLSPKAIRGACIAVIHRGIHPPGADDRPERLGALAGANRRACREVQANRPPEVRATTATGAQRSPGSNVGSSARDLNGRRESPAKALRQRDERRERG